MEEPVMSAVLSDPQSPASSLDKDEDKQFNSPISAVSNPSQCHSVMLCGQPIAALMIDSNERLCLAQISNTLLKNFSYNEIHNRRVALGITCVQCTPVQLEILRRAGAMPVSSRRCGMISKREAERLCKSFLCDNLPPKLPDNFAFEVFHACSWGCRGNFIPTRYNSSRAKCIKCVYCNLFFSPNKFIFHFHRTPTSKYQQPDAANFNSWRRHIRLNEDNPGEDLLHAWEDVKAMFNGGSRKRSMYLATTPSPSKQSHTSPLGHGPPVTKSSRLDIDPVITNLSLGHGLGYPIMPIPNRSFGAPGTDPLANEKQEAHSMFGSSAGAPFFGRQFSTQAIRPRTLTDMFWPNGRVPAYPFPTGFWPKGRDGNFLVSAGTAALDKTFGSPCLLAPESGMRFLGSLNLPPTANVIESEREEIREEINSRSLHSYRFEQNNINCTNKYTSAFRRVKKTVSSPEHELGGFLGNSSEGERLTSPLETHDDTSSSPVSVNTAQLYFGCGLDSAAEIENKQDNDELSEEVGCVEEAKRENPQCTSETKTKITSEDEDNEEKEGKNEQTEKHVLSSPTDSPKEDLADDSELATTDCAVSESTSSLAKETAPATDDLTHELLKEVEARERITRECRMLKDSFDGFMMREAQHMQLKDQLRIELEQERKARHNTQQKLKEAQDTLQEFSYKMILSRHCVDGARNLTYSRAVQDKTHNE